VHYVVEELPDKAITILGGLKSLLAVSFLPKPLNTLAVTKVFLKCFLQKLPLAIVIFNI